MSAKRSVKARKMFTLCGVLDKNVIQQLIYNKEVAGPNDMTCYVLPADMESYDTMREQVAKAYYEQDSGAGFRGASDPVPWEKYPYHLDYINRAMAVLKAIGITRAAKTGK